VKIVLVLIVLMLLLMMMMMMMIIRMLIKRRKVRNIHIRMIAIGEVGVQIRAERNKAAVIAAVAACLVAIKKVWTHRLPAKG
jgi:hypothetical protein